MPRGSRPGERRGGRQKGTPNKVTSAAREAFLAIFERLTPDVETWIRQTANGWDVEVMTKAGPTIVRQGKDPGKAADLALRLAEYHVPKLAKTEVTGADGAALHITVQTLPPEKGEEG